MDFGEILGDGLAAWVEIEKNKSATNLDAYQQGLNQGAALQAPEKQSQQTEAVDITDSQYGTQQLISGVDNRLILGAGLLVGAVVLFKVMD